MVKRIAIGLFLILLAVAGIVAYGVYNLDGLVKTAIEKYGSEMTGCTVKVRSVSIDIRAGKGVVKGLRISNPRGFSSADAFSLGETTLDIQPGSMTEVPIVIEQIVIRQPHVNFEVNESNQANLKAIQDNLNRYSPTTPASAEGAAGEGDPGESLLFRVDHFDFEAANVKADTSAIGGETVEVDLPEHHMKNVGGRTGATGPEIGQKILTYYTAKVLKIVAANQLDRVIDRKLKGQEGEAAKELLRRLMK